MRAGGRRLGPAFRSSMPTMPLRRGRQPGINSSSACRARHERQRHHQRFQRRADGFDQRDLRASPSACRGSRRRMNARQLHPITIRPKRNAPAQHLHGRVTYRQLAHVERRHGRLRCGRRCRAFRARGRRRRRRGGFRRCCTRGRGRSCSRSCGWSRGGGRGLRRFRVRAANHCTSYFHQDAAQLGVDRGRGRCQRERQAKSNLPLH